MQINIHIMKTKLVLLIPCILISCAAFSQDSTFSYQYKNKIIPKKKQQVYPAITSGSKVNADASHFYSDTRLGSSSPLYNSYQKNDYGAGAITNDYHKGQNGQIYGNNLPEINSTSNTTIYRDTRLGSSSPMYNSYQKNDFGAGAITTNPNKSGGSVQEFIPANTDTLKKQ
jgi:hypothetical protein